MSAVRTVSETNINGLSLVHRGKVRDVYEVDEDRLLLVATDRLSAFDCILPNPIPDKGVILTQISAFWFEKLKDLTANHLITANFDEMPEIIKENYELKGRSTLVKKTKVFPVECVVRGYLEGSGWKDYQATGEICGHTLPENLRQCDRLPEPLFTPATKAATGHDENITEAECAEIIGAENAEKLKSLSLNIYKTASEYALSRGIIIADTKFEFGVDKDGQILLIDEVLTPDSSRFWSVETYSPGKASRHSINNLSANIWKVSIGTKRRPRPNCPKRLSRRRETGIYRLLRF